MPRAHTTEELERIHERLLEAGRERFAKVGLAKVTIADLALDAGIGKGSFYKFFESKEDLFLAIQEQQEAAFKQALRAELLRAGSPRQAVVTLLMAAATRLDAHPFLRLLLDPKTLAELQIRVDPQRLAAHRQSDRDFFVSLVHEGQQQGWLRETLCAQTVFDVLGAMFMISVQRELLGPEATRRATAELAEALAERWCPPSDPRDKG
ncbi:MAG: TetR/AcrR family transcriptional regulator [Myxococcota bacterium]